MWDKSSALHVVFMPLDILQGRRIGTPRLQAEAHGIFSVAPWKQDDDQTVQYWYIVGSVREAMYSDGK